MEPIRKRIAEPFSKGKYHLPRGSSVWLIQLLADGRALVEYNNERFEVPADILQETSCSGSTRETESLKALDLCFTRRDRMKQVHIDFHRWFRILECEHGNLFLEETVEGFALRDRLIFIGELPRTEAAFVDFWERHHGLSDDEIRLRGNRLP